MNHKRVWQSTLKTQNNLTYMLNRSHRRSCAETRKNEQITLLHLEKLLMWAWLGQYANLMKQKSIGRPNSYVSSLLTINSLWRGKGKSMLELWVKAMKEKLIQPNLSGCHFCSYSTWKTIRKKEKSRQEEQLFQSPKCWNSRTRPQLTAKQSIKHAMNEGKKDFIQLVSMKGYMAESQSIYYHWGHTNVLAEGFCSRPRLQQSSWKWVDKKEINKKYTSKDLTVSSVVALGLYQIICFVILK